MKPTIELADLMRQVVASGKLNASLEQWEVVNAIMNCRTENLGGHLYYCKDCGKEQPRYNSCRNRHCPKCQGREIAKWLEKRQEELLPVPYFHIVFTIPHELNGIALQNKRIVFDLLFKAVAKTLKQVTQNRLGGDVGFFGVLHTWGQKMEFHPHIHCVVPGVIIKPDSSIEKTKDGYFLPQRVLSLVFRAIFSKLLRRAYKKLCFHGTEKPHSSKKSYDFLLTQLFKKDWVVYAKKPFSGAEAVLKYLSRYTHRVAISNNRIVSNSNGKTTFTYKDYADNCSKKYLSIDTAKFVRRFLLHVLPKQFVRIRHFGFMANSKRTRVLTILKNKLKTKPLLLPTLSKPCCPHCGSEALIIVKEFSPKLFLLKPQIQPKTPKTKQLPLVA